MRKFILPLLFTLGYFFAGAQSLSEYAVIGAHCPGFKFEEVRYFKRDQVSLSDFNGQWLVLDFWNKHCGTCIEKMPGMDSLQKRFAGKVNVLLVGYTGSMYTHRPDSSIREFYGDLRKRMKVDLPIAYDSIQFHRLAIGSCPYIVIVDPKGIVRGITTRLKSKDMNTFLAGNQPKLEKATNRYGQ